MSLRRVYDNCTFCARHEIPNVSVENYQNVFFAQVQSTLDEASWKQVYIRISDTLNGQMINNKMPPNQIQRKTNTKRTNYKFVKLL